MSVYFYDSSALQHKYVAGPALQTVHATIQNTTTKCYIAELTLLEMASALGTRCRAGRLGIVDYDAMNAKFMDDIYEERLHVHATTKAQIIRARHLLRYAGVVSQRRLSSHDALIATGCLDLAHHLQARVTFCLDDGPLYDIIKGIGAFASALTFEYLATRQTSSSATSRNPL